MAQEIRSGEQIISAAVALADKHRPAQVAVAAAADEAALEAVTHAVKVGLCRATLFGERAKIERIAAENGLGLSGVEIHDQADPNQAVYAAVQQADQGHADVLMKGFVGTSALLKTVLSRDFKLRGKNTLSHTAVLGIPGYHKLLGITDGGMVVKPDFDTKLQLIENSALIFNALGFARPKVALSGAIDYVDPRLSSTVLNQKIVEHYRSARPGDCEVYGPLTLDAATDRRVAASRGINSPVAGDADIFVVDSIEECNITSKVLILFAKAVFAGVIIGARVPISLVSRTDTVQNKLASLALACLVAHYQRELWGGHA